jgi:hypothetical protein
MNATIVECKERITKCYIQIKLMFYFCNLVEENMNLVHEIKYE